MRKQRLVVVALASLVVVVPLRALANDAPARSDVCRMFDHDHAKWTALLSRFVKNGIVDYAALKATAGAALAGYLVSLERVDSPCFDGFLKNQKFAFWINAYNAYTVELILDHYPLKSIRSIGLLPLAAFRKRFIPLRVAGASDMSLNDIENDQLRKAIADPRLHFAIVCASTSCPSLRSEAYRAPDLDRQLDEAARLFVNDKTRNRYDDTTKTLLLSSIFKWFRGDFERPGRTLAQFVTGFWDTADPVRPALVDAKIEFLDYDWSLNGT